MLSPEFVRDLVIEINTLLDQEEPTLGVRIAELGRRLAEVDHDIEVLLDFAEQFGRPAQVTGSWHGRRSSGN